MGLLLQSWIPFALLAGVAMLGYQICAKLAGEQLPATIFATVMYTAGFIAVMPLFAYWLSRDSNSIEVIKTMPMWPIIFSALAGIAVIFVDTSIATMFAKNAPLGIGMSTIFVLALFLAGVTGVLFFGERPSFINILGFLLAIGSIPLMLYGNK